MKNLATLWRQFVHMLAFGFGAGLAPVAPGTVGTLVAVPVWWLLAQLSITVYCVIVVGMGLAGIWICGKTARDLNTPDHPGIVWDEIIGYLITMFMAPVSAVWMVIGFLLFRLFDIWKPFPIRWLERRVPGGLGIVLDDVMAGLYAFAVMQALLILAARIAP